MNFLEQIRSAIRRTRQRLTLQRYSKQLQMAVQPESEEYRTYLDVQLQRTLNKRDAPLQERTILLIDQVSKFIDLSHCDVLCIGCRNTSEIDYFYSKGARQVTGIDLYSESPHILVMDMHEMKFADRSFDVVYSAHSLEHALNPGQVIQEIGRVARPGALVAVEVPVRYETRGADLSDFRSTEALRTAFSSHIDRVIWEDEQEANSPLNASGTPVARTIFVVSQRGDAEDVGTENIGD